VITETCARGKIEYLEEKQQKLAGRVHRPHLILARRVFGNSDALLGFALQMSAFDPKRTLDHGRYPICPFAMTETPERGFADFCHGRL
jgi:hypothetical protein